MELRKLTNLSLAACASAILGLSTIASAADVSLLSGLYKSSKVRDGLESTSISFGGRYSDLFEDNMAWFGEFALDIKSYSISGGNEPSDQTDILFGGGVRYFFDKLSEKVTPYGAATLHYKSMTSDPSTSSVTTGTTTTAGWGWTETSGLFYGADVGMRFDFGSNVFAEVEVGLFESPLTAKEESIRKTGTSETKTETSKVALYFDTYGSLFSDATVAIGMKI